MKFPVYAVHDDLIGYSMPILRDNDSVASRAFEFDCTRDDSPYRVHPEQFSLYHIGEYDTETAEISSVAPRFVARASDFIGDK